MNCVGYPIYSIDSIDLEGCVRSGKEGLGIVGGVVGGLDFGEEQKDGEMAEESEEHGVGWGHVM